MGLLSDEAPSLVCHTEAAVRKIGCDLDNEENLPAECGRVVHWQNKDHLE
jgi:hypothetical protein